MATEVVGDTQAFSANAMPRPRLTVPLPRSNFSDQRMPVGDVFEHRFERRILEDRAGRLRPAVAQHVLAAELERIDLQRARHHVGVALIGEGELRHAEAAQRAGRRHVGVHRVGVDREVVDVVGTGGGEAGFVRDARADIRIGAAVPVHFAFARGDAAALVDAGS